MPSPQTVPAPALRAPSVDSACHPGTSVERVRETFLGCDAEGQPQTLKAAVDCPVIDRLLRRDLASARKAGGGRRRLATASVAQAAIDLLAHA